MTDYKKVGTKKIEGKKQPVNVYKKAGSSKLYVIHKTAKSKFMSYVNYKKMYAKKVAAKKVVKRKVVKRRRPTSKRGGNVLYETKWGATGGEDIAMTGKDLGLSLPKEYDMDQNTDMDQDTDMNQNTDVTVGGIKNRNNKNRINKNKKGGSGCGYHEAMNGGLRRRRKGGNIEDNEYNLDELLGGARGRKKRKTKSKKLKGGNDDIAHTISLEDLDAMQGGNFDMEGGRRRGSMFSRRSRGRAFGRRRGGELDDLLGGAQRRRTTRKRGGDLNDLLGGARRRRTRRPKLT